jgi:hypothetical protein
VILYCEQQTEPLHREVIFFFVIDIRINHIFVKAWLELLYEICKQVDMMRKYMLLEVSKCTP